jgi:hypothetical protein
MAGLAAFNSLGRKIIPSAWLRTTVVSISEIRRIATFSRA